MTGDSHFIEAPAFIRPNGNIVIPTGQQDRWGCWYAEFQKTDAGLKKVRETDYVPVDCAALLGEPLTYTDFLENDE